MNNSISTLTARHPVAAKQIDWDLSSVQLSGWLRKAAAPTFAGMAFVTGLSEHAMPLACSALGHAGHLCGMTTMYVLMALFHLSAWLPRSTPGGFQSTSRSQS